MLPPEATVAVALRDSAPARAPTLTPVEAPQATPTRALAPVRGRWSRGWRLFGLLLLPTLALRLPAFFFDGFHSADAFRATQAPALRSGGDLYHEAAHR